MQSIQVGKAGSVKKTPSNVTGLNITTIDAHTLTDGPTIFLSNNVENLGKYYIRQTQLPERVYNSLVSNIESNNVIQKELTTNEHELEYLQEKILTSDPKNGGKGTGKTKDRKLTRNIDEHKQNPEIRRLTQKIENLHSRIRTVNLDEMYIPNTKPHQQIWTDGFKSESFIPRIQEEDVCAIMGLDVDNDKKMLLLLGIGMFTNENDANPRYMEIMKRLAYNQQLYVILASSDYIYGTNYQFCHGYIGKDLLHMTQQKTIQALGRIGRNNMQQEYTIRFRDNNMLLQLFKSPLENKEAVIMNKLFAY